MEFILKKEILAPLIIIVVCLILCVLTKKIVKRIFKTKKVDGRKKTIINLISNVIRFIIIMISLLTILEIYGIDTKSLLASFGIVGLVAGLALQDSLKDFIVGIAIIFENQFQIGDWVEIDGFIGEVSPSNLRTTKLKAINGEVKYVANRNISEVINYSSTGCAKVTDISVAYESDLDKVRKILDDLCENLKEKYNIKFMIVQGVQELADSAIVFRIKTITNYPKQFDIDRIIKEEVVKTFNKNGITIPFNQVVIHNG